MSDIVINLTLRPASQQQQQDGVIDLPQGMYECLKWFSAEAMEAPEKVHHAAGVISTIPIQYCREKGISTKNVRCLLGGDPLLMASIEEHLWVNRFIPVCSRYERRPVPELKKPGMMFIPEEMVHTGFIYLKEPQWRKEDRERREERERREYKV